MKFDFGDKVATVTRQQLLVLGVALIILLGLIAAGSGQNSPAVSVEAKFADTSHTGLAIVPASCPSSPHYSGQCSVSCNGGYEYYGDGTIVVPTQTCGTPTPTCSNGATNYPTCGCTNGATNYPTCTLPTSGSCSNGATNYPTCTPTTTSSCSNGAINYPTCMLCPSGEAMDLGTCVPAITSTTCPSGETLSGGQCITTAPSCSSTRYCSSDKTRVISVSSSCVASSHDCSTEAAFCSTSSGAAECVPFPITFTGFRATLPDGSTFDATGHLQAKPELLRPGQTSQLYWNVQYIQSCTLTGSDGESWSFTAPASNRKQPPPHNGPGPGPAQNGNSASSAVFTSGLTGKSTSAIEGQTIFTLHCTANPGATPSSITETATVNVVPTYQEQ